MSQSDLVSIIIPMKNGGTYIEETLKSVQNQTWKNFDILVIDDFSNDNGVEIVKSMKSIDQRIRLLQLKSHKGVAKVRNLGLRLAKGKYIAFLDCDDIWHKDKILRQVAALKENDADFCYTSYCMVDERGEKVKQYDVKTEFLTEEKLLKENVIGTSSVLADSVLVRQHKFSSQLFHDDYAFWLRLICNGAVMYGMSDILVKYRIHKKNYSHDKLYCAKERWRVYREFMNFSRRRSLYYFFSYMLQGVKKYYI